MADWHVTRAAFAPVLALGIIGLSLGTMIAGWLGDRYGRRLLLAISLTLFGLMTAITTTTSNMPELMLVRFLAGLGIGGAVPNAATLLAEFTPSRQQMLSVTMGIACIPIGGVVAGNLAAVAIPMFGWHIMYLFGGLAPIAVAILVMSALPESPHFLVRDRLSWPRLARDLNTMIGQLRYPQNTQFVPEADDTRTPFAPFCRSPIAAIPWHCGRLISAICSAYSFSSIGCRLSWLR
jgi:AAHS family 4-hydroxybenzoate transporter-like MFS transporter